MNNNSRGESNVQHATDQRERRRQVERLASGDLVDAERDELFHWLETEPTRWRLCGLALLEAQVLRESRQDAMHCVGQSVSVPARRSARGMLGIAASVAALVLVAFGVGWWGGRTGPSAVDSDERAGTASPVRSEPHGRPGGSVSTRGQGAGSPSAEAVHAGSLHDTQPRVVMAVDRPRDRQFTLPIVDGDLPADHWARGLSIPESVKSNWERLGYRVAETQRLVPGETDDGRKVVMAVNQVSLTFIGKRSL